MENKICNGYQGNNVDFGNCGYNQLNPTCGIIPEGGRIVDVNEGFRGGGRGGGGRGGGGRGGGGRGGGGRGGRGGRHGGRGGRHGGRGGRYYRNRGYGYGYNYYGGGYPYWGSYYDYPYYGYNNVPYNNTPIVIKTEETPPPTEPSNQKDNSQIYLILGVAIAMMLLFILIKK